MINILGIILGTLISCLWIFLPLKRVPEEIRLKNRTYIISIIMGATLCTLVIIIVEILWDRLTGISAGHARNMLQAIVISFARAALLEESVKYIFVKRALKKYQPQGRLQYMLLAGTIGVGYGITEKLTFGSAAAMLVYLVLALHIMFQFVMGWYLYEADNTDNPVKKKTLQMKALLLPLVVHGVWDSIQFGVELYMTDDMIVACTVALLLWLAAVIAGVVWEVRMAMYLKSL